MRALVFGKFLPFHNGHLAMIDYAQKKYDNVTAVVFSRGGETWPGELRTEWIRTTRPNIKVLHCPMDFCDPHDEESWEFWASTLKKIGHDCSHLVTSEDYGDETASRCGMTHDMYDITRTVVSISGTAVRNDTIRYFKFLPPAVKKDLVKKIVFVGAESTGKSTMSQDLAKKYETVCVPEFGRELCEWKSVHDFGIRDFEEIAREQLRRERELAVSSNGLMFCDTEIIVTRAWAKELLGFEPESMKGRINQYDLYAVTNITTPWVNDGTRYCENPETRQRFHEFILKEVNKSGSPVVQLPKRYSDAVHLVSDIVDTCFISTSQIV